MNTEGLDRMVFGWLLSWCNLRLEVWRDRFSLASYFNKVSRSPNLVLDKPRHKWIEILLIERKII